MMFQGSIKQKQFLQLNKHLSAFSQFSGSFFYIQLEYQILEKVITLPIFHLNDNKYRQYYTKMNYKFLMYQSWALKSSKVLIA